MKLQDKVVLVTGASAGMGRSIALLFAKEGAKVVAVARRKERLDEIVRESQDFAGSIQAKQGDVSVQKQMEAIVDEVVSEYGRLDVLINNAGIMDEMAPVGDVSNEMWEKIMKVNLDGPFFLCRKAVNQMLKQESGSIVNVASIGGLQGSRAGAAYTASKFALVGLSKNIGFMYATKGIRCNVICPGAVSTEIGASMGTPNLFGLERAMSGIKINPRNGEADEIAKAALFLASEDSSFVNGTVLVADGGWTAY